jgi:hypothetical protein
MKEELSFKKEENMSVERVKEDFFEIQKGRIYFNPNTGEAAIFPGRTEINYKQDDDGNFRFIRIYGERYIGKPSEQEKDNYAKEISEILKNFRVIDDPQNPGKKILERSIVTEEMRQDAQEREKEELNRHVSGGRRDDTTDLESQKEDIDKEQI